MGLVKGWGEAQLNLNWTYKIIVRSIAQTFNQLVSVSLSLSPKKKRRKQQETQNEINNCNYTYWWLKVVTLLCRVFINVFVFACFHIYYHMLSSSLLSALSCLLSLISYGWWRFFHNKNRTLPMLADSQALFLWRSSSSPFPSSSHCRTRTFSLFVFYTAIKFI